ncbi:hypothetical protein BS17DRAFT_789041 [Gyrodon lividus]|nr:hypothetical protein BS17DRAFT_789041 [Gyrodon lividus]
MADHNLETPPNYAGAELDITREGLRLGYHENDNQVIEHLVGASCLHWHLGHVCRL